MTGNELRWQREEVLKVSQYRLAELMGISRRKVQYLEAGDSVPALYENALKGILAGEHDKLDAA